MTSEFRDLDDVRNFLDSHFGVDKSDEIMETIYATIDKRVAARADEIESEWEDRVCEAEDERDDAEAEADDLREQVNDLESEISDLEEEIEILERLNETIPF